jgi:hypothetical protein
MKQIPTVSVAGRHALSVAKETIITAYQVCQDTISRNSTKTAYLQQWTLLRTIHGIFDLDPDPDLWKQLITDLDSLINQESGTRASALT